MLFNEMFDVARNTAAKYQNTRNPLTFNDTICVVHTRNDRIIVGISSLRYINNQPVPVHAEIDACNRLKENSDISVAEISVFNAVNLQPVLPCKHCVSKIMELVPENNKTILVLPDRCIPLFQMEQFLSGQNVNQEQFQSPGRYNNDNYSYFTGRLNQILDDDDDDEEEEKSKNKKEKTAGKGLFGFFRRKGNGENK